MSSNTVYFVTGAARGLGKAFVANYLARSGTTVIAAVRNSSSSGSLKDLPVGKGSKLVIVEIDSRDPPTAAKAISSLESQGISKIDVVIANAAISTEADPVADVKLDVLKEHVEVNAYGPLVLFQAVLPLLQKSSNPKFAALGSPLGSITGMESRPFPAASYGISKVALHWIVRKIHLEHANITSFALDPGFVQTDMGNSGAQRVGMEKAFITTEESINFLVPAIDKATKAATSGHFPSIEGGDFAW
ncbi:putative aflatoxin biosynthesis ketoreductase nor-1 [Lophiostoma macrostomum CBS 122681]|uniref:Putative aflatoxin biosynthesis ketoreductase nor-1 n=1 Tax=Lophiostoma macrostomum CBS 122681 TaxID=1314788 RepID=A0A6A6SLZ1_9PLEO|nr:putative aflatoxin biosynthesis ketoreductase nor-1 [Lophiostoma macrostomum CBS 122681]